MCLIARREPGRHAYIELHVAACTDVAMGEGARARANGGSPQRSLELRGWFYLFFRGISESDA